MPSSGRAAPAGMAASPCPPKLRLSENLKSPTTGSVRGPAGVPQKEVVGGRPGGVVAGAPRAPAGALDGAPLRVEPREDAADHAAGVLDAGDGARPLDGVLAQHPAAT